MWIQHPPDRDLGGQGIARVGTGSQAGLSQGITPTSTPIRGPTSTTTSTSRSTPGQRRPVRFAQPRRTLWEGTFKVQENLQVIDASGTVAYATLAEEVHPGVRDNGDNAPGATLISEIVRDVGHRPLANSTPTKYARG